MYLITNTSYKQKMKIVKQFALILLFLLLGDLIGTILHIPVPANVLGMVLMFTGLLSGIVKLKDVDEVSTFIIKYLPIFYVVPSVGIMLYLDLLKKEFVGIIVPVFLSIILGFFAAGKVTEILMKKEGNNND